MLNSCVRYGWKDKLWDELYISITSSENIYAQVYRDYKSNFKKQNCSSQFRPLPVHCCPISCKWTLEPTLNKKSQDCLVLLHPVKKQATAGFLANVYLCALGQHYASNFLVQCRLRRICTTLSIQYSMLPTLFKKTRLYRTDSLKQFASVIYFISEFKTITKKRASI